MIDLGKNRLRPSNIDFINKSDDDSVMSNVMIMTNLTDPTDYSKDELVEILQNACISRRYSVKGSAHKGNGNPHHLVGKTEEAIACVNMFNKNIGAYLIYNFPNKLGMEFIKRLLRVSVDPELIKDIVDCTWDKKTRVLRTPKDIEDAGKKKLKDAAWYKKDYAVNISNGSKNYNKKEKLLAPENLYTLGDDHTYTTLNERPRTYADSPGAAMIDLEKNRLRPSNIDLTNGSDDDSVMSNVTIMTND